MDAAKLVKMANEIAGFFASEPDPVAAVDGVAGHLQRFWEPRMRRQIFATLDAGAPEMTPMVVEALNKHRTRLEPGA